MLNEKSKAQENILYDAIHLEFFKCQNYLNRLVGDTN